MRSTSTRTSPPAARRLSTVRLPEQLGEVIQLHPPTVADPAARPAPAGDQLALPLFLLLDGEGQG